VPSGAEESALLFFGRKTGRADRTPKGVLPVLPFARQAGMANRNLVPREKLFQAKRMVRRKSATHGCFPQRLG